MSQINVDQILAEDGNPTTEVSIPSLNTRMASAWVNFDGTGTVAIRDSLNVSSITDLAPGSYAVNFSALMSDNDYSVSATASSVNSGSIVYVSTFSKIGRASCRERV